MLFEKLPIEGIWLAKPKVFGDERGYFMEAFKVSDWEEKLGIRFIQDNESSSLKGVVRGLHVQRPPYSQAKLVRVLRGCIWDVAVDLRPGPGQGKFIGVELSEDNKNQLFIPEGFAHGFCVLSPIAQILYKVDKAYHPEAEESIFYDDPDLAIPWPLGEQDRILSAKDKQGMSWKQFLNTK